jgi:hypothetical protein
MVSRAEALVRGINDAACRDALMIMLVAREASKNPQVKYRGELHPHLTCMLQKRDAGDTKLFTSRRRWRAQKQKGPRLLFGALGP